jgi:hypothetical protein
MSGCAREVPALQCRFHVVYVGHHWTLSRPLRHYIGSCQRLSPRLGFGRDASLCPDRNAAVLAGPSRYTAAWLQRAWPRRQRRKRVGTPARRFTAARCGAAACAVRAVKNAPQSASAQGRWHVDRAVGHAVCSRSRAGQCDCNRLYQPCPYVLDQTRLHYNEVIKRTTEE